MDTFQFIALIVFASAIKGRPTAEPAPSDPTSIANPIAVAAPQIPDRIAPKVSPLTY